MNGLTSLFSLPCVRNMLRKFPPYFKSINPASFFILCSVFFFFIYNFFTPPLQSPDELNHLYRIYQLSEGNLLSQKIDQRVGGNIPYSVNEFALPMRLVSSSEHKLHASDYDRLLNQPVEAHVNVFRDFPNTAQYNIVSYLPQVAAFIILKAINAPVIVLYYWARLAAFLIWTLLILWSIRLIPFAKWLMVLLALLPMNLYISNSLSADTVTNGLSFLLISFVMHLTFSATMLTAKKKILLLVICVLLSLAKVVYMPLVLLVLMIPAAHFDSTRKKLVYCAGLFVISLFSALLWSGVVMKNYIPDSEYNPVHRNDATVGFHANIHRQKEFIMHHPFYFPKVIVNTVFNSPQPYLKSYIGFFGAYQDRPMATPIYWLAWLGILLVTFFGTGNILITAQQRAIMLLAAFSAFFCLLLSQHLSWDQVGSGIMELMQGRYIIPIMPLVLISVSGLLKRQLNVSTVIIGLVLFLNACAAYTLFKRYIHVPYEKSVVFTTSLEVQDNDREFVTTDPSYKLNADSHTTPPNVRSGQSAAISSPQFPYVLGCNLSNISGGDLVEVELWQKGKGASLVLTGDAKECGTIYIANNEPDYMDSRGWEHVHLHYKVPGNCRNFDLNFMVHNPGQNSVYIDDLSFTIRRGIKK